MNNITYEYSNENIEYDLDKPIVNAIYKKAQCKIDQGNPLIEALPYPLSMKDVIRYNYKAIIGFDYKELINSSLTSKYARISELDTFRFPLPFQYSLSCEINRILLNSYRKRYFINDLNNIGNLSITVEDNKIPSYVSIYSDAEDGISGSIAILGPSGSGKSSSIKTSLSYMPQVIRHKLSEDKFFTQITYVHASCNTSLHEDFGSLLVDIGRSIDRALCNRARTYENYVKKAGSLGRKIDSIIELINLFGIGLIVLDEVENLNFNKNKNASYSKLLTLMNITKVGIIFVGTNDVFEKMYTDEKMRRRFQPFNVSEYSKDMDFLSAFLQALFKYQWFEPMLITKDEEGYTKEFLDICQVFMEWTKGIVALVVKLYQCMITEYLNRSKPKVDAHFVESVAKKYLYNLKDYLDNQIDPFTYKSIKKIMKDATEQMEAVKRLEGNKKKNKEVLEIASSDEFEKEIYEKEKIVKMVIDFTDEKYQEAIITKYVDRVFSLKSAQDKNDMWKVKKTLSYLGEYKEKKKPTKTQKKKQIKKEDPDKLMAELLENETPLTE